MHDAGLVEYTPAANVSPEGYLYTHPQVWPCCEWNTSSPLTELMNTAAEFEIDTAVRKTLKWLVALEQGVHLMISTCRLPVYVFVKRIEACH